VQFPFSLGVLAQGTPLWMFRYSNCFIPWSNLSSHWANFWPWTSNIYSAVVTYRWTERINHKLRSTTGEPVFNRWNEYWHTWNRNWGHVTLCPVLADWTCKSEIEIWKAEWRTGCSYRAYWAKDMWTIAINHRASFGL
jgi:hypothetical protein